MEYFGQLVEQSSSSRLRKAMLQQRICSRTELLEKETEHEQTGIVENAAAAEDSEACVVTNSLACCAVVGVVR